MRMLTISLALAVSACSTAEATPSAPPSTEARKVEAFHGLNLTAVVGVEVAITMPDLTSIDISGVASVHAARLATKALDVMISGTGSVDLAGTVETLKVSSAGTGSIAAKELKAATVSMELGGTGEAVVTATKRIDATISGTGAITVYGKPATVNKSITGVGDVELR